jgi:hypothetical protein
MTRIPTSALLLGLAGLFPFLWGAAGLLVPAIAEISRQTMSPDFSHRVLLGQYGIVILCFMSGVIWGFATRAEGRLATTFYVLSVLPALWAFGVGFVPLRLSILWIALGFAGLLLIDLAAARRGLAPEWWMRLRLLLSAVVLLCLGIGVAA